MYISLVKKFGSLLLVLFFSLVTKAQQVHFVYLQTENAQPFYVKMDNKVISSSSEGYIILPGLQDGNYQLVVGFPKREYPEEKFDLPVNKVNEGFLLKNFDGDWKLFNLQTLALTDGISEKPVAVANAKEADRFSTMLASVVKDSSILQNHEVVVKTPAAPPADTVASVVVNNNNANPVIDSAKTAADTETVVHMAADISQVLKRIDSEGLQMVYVDKNDDKQDTIRIFIPEKKVTTPANDSTVAEKKEPSEQKNIATISGLTITPTVVEVNPDSAQLKNDTSGYISRAPAEVADTNSVSGSNNNLANPVQDSASLVQKEIEKPATDTVAENKEVTDEKDKAAPVIVLHPQTNKKAAKGEKQGKQDELILLPKVVTTSEVNSDCKSFATNEDFLKLRRKMASENGNEKMIQVAKKSFKAKCYSTEQVKDLSYLFLTDEGKYMFFDAAYPFTSDSDRFGQLASQFSDEYFLNRFKALLRK